ncbi:response regulator transcription factor [Agrobacterium genomosp. 13]|uniref:Response regulator receiver protein n=1 Tax=Agrobacterium genomosp. 13 str. CFBP 6927 TaxID=1183428 RepID=A0ABM9VLB1_9HYPH|nr:response regulator [Agrobacterium genomosp. 13]CUX58085.1 Response regulator receiver protein [Agrobacterium genomosp. 13 str. CFBP 6927]
MSARGNTVAIVDDDPKVLEALRDLLESKGFKVFTFNSAKALLSDTRLAMIDCLITDIAMPDMNGVELGRETTLKRPELPIFYITGDSEMASLAGSAFQGKERVFKKPFDSTMLIAALQSAIYIGPI